MECSSCSQLFTKKSPLQRFCSNACKERYFDQNNIQVNQDYKLAIIRRYILACNHLMDHRSANARFEYHQAQSALKETKF